jgi:hypothetical protein
MKSLLSIVIILIISCCSANKTVEESTKIKDAAQITGKGDQNVSDSSLPVCIKKLINQFQQEEKQNPPRSIYSYMYKGKLVFYVPPICCDFFSDLYDSDCNLIAHPDGGFTGRGDGKVLDFMQTRTGEKLIWKDNR